VLFDQKEVSKRHINKDNSGLEKDGLRGFWSILTNLTKSTEQFKAI
jgi:hypothetical protein